MYILVVLLIIFLVLKCWVVWLEVLGMSVNDFFVMRKIF